MALACDSAKPFLDEIVKTLKHIEEILSYVGIFYIGKFTVKTLWSIVSGARTHILSKLTAPRFVEKYGKWAVVNGSTDILGRAFAFELAKNRMNILLISDESKKMEEVACGIKNEFSVEVDLLAVDFYNSSITREEISSALLQKDIGIFINNARFLTQERALQDKSACRTLNAIVEVGPPITKIILDGMLERKRGAIINISSLDTYFSEPYGQLSSTASVFIHSYSLALERMCWHSGVTAQTLLLGPLSNSKSSCWKAFFSYIFAPSPSSYAYHAIRTLGYSSHTTGYWSHGILILCKMEIIKKPHGRVCHGEEGERFGCSQFVSTRGIFVLGDFVF